MSMVLAEIDTHKEVPGDQEKPPNPEGGIRTENRYNTMYSLEAIRPLSSQETVLRAMDLLSNYLSFLESIGYRSALTVPELKTYIDQIRKNNGAVVPGQTRVDKQFGVDVIRLTSISFAFAVREHEALANNPQRGDSAQQIISESWQLTTNTLLQNLSVLLGNSSDEEQYNWEDRALVVGIISVHLREIIAAKETVFRNLPQIHSLFAERAEQLDALSALMIREIYNNNRSHQNAVTTSLSNVSSLPLNLEQVITLLEENNLTVPKILEDLKDKQVTELIAANFEQAKVELLERIGVSDQVKELVIGAIRMNRRIDSASLNAQLSSVIEQLAACTECFVHNNAEVQAVANVVLVGLVKLFEQDPEPTQESELLYRYQPYSGEPQVLVEPSHIDPTDQTTVLKLLVSVLFGSAVIGQYNTLMINEKYSGYHQALLGSPMSQEELLDLLLMPKDEVDSLVLGEEAEAGGLLQRVFKIVRDLM